MCFHTKQTAQAQELKNRFKAEFPKENEYQAKEHVNGFEHAKSPVITNENRTTIQLFNWGIVPSWANDLSIQQSTLNARLETLKEKASFKNYVSQRCIIPVTGFYEWKWHDGKGKTKEKYLIEVENQEVFCFAGLWNRCTNPQTGNEIESYTIITTQANELMAEIHHAKRMPVILKDENEWLEKGTFTLNHQLRATSLEPPPLTLF